MEPQLVTRCSLRAGPGSRFELATTRAGAHWEAGFGEAGRELPTAGGTRHLLCSTDLREPVRAKDHLLEPGFPHAL